MGLNYLSNNAGELETIPQSFEFIVKNKMAWGVTYVFDAQGDITTKTMTNGTDTITATYTYSNDLVSSIVLSGDIPTGISATKNITYDSNEYPASVNYS